MAKSEERRCLKDVSIDSRVILKREGVEGIHLAQDRDRWRSFVKRVINGPLEYVNTLILFCAAR